ncbi:hypothetical protein BpHYR1_007348 [Brachionus plicatilis]|uniref:Uncharacterized protein n=1 Tax=Brachionus plicatilis TaxID=10195 RepID=A0A3M7PC74_BRAPC|nr:hypothetical protein BpHYR1_007348 [Brachionus plicatilis]
MSLCSMKYDYVQSNHYKVENDDESNVVKDGYEVFCDGFLFAKNKKNKTSNCLVCKHPKCSASLAISHDGSIINVSKESHIIVFKDGERRQTTSTEKEMLLSNDLTLDGYVKYVMPLYIFKKTKTLKGNESDESDSEGEDCNVMSDEEETLD